MRWQAVIQDNEAWLPVLPTGGSIEWNPYRGRYVLVSVDKSGHLEGDLPPCYPRNQLSAFLWSTHGEIFYAEGDTPQGPWVYSRKVATSTLPSDRYYLYLPQHHPIYDDEHGRVIHFTGTHVQNVNEIFEQGDRLAGYDYNALVYRVELDREELALPVPIYDLEDDGAPRTFVDKSGLRPGDPDRVAPFFALDRRAPGSVPVAWSGAACANPALQAGESPPTKPIFFAQPAPGDFGLFLPLHEFVDESGDRAYSVADQIGGTYEPTDIPGDPDDAVAWVWANPMSGVELPVTEYLSPLLPDAGPDLCETELYPGLGVIRSLEAENAGTGTVASWRWLRWYGESAEFQLADGQVVDVLANAGVQTFVAAATDSDGLERSDFTVIEVSSPVDGDGDGLFDYRDNCTFVPNPDQRDEDGYGTACDGDYDQDGSVGPIDQDLLAEVYAGTVPFDPRMDHNGDGVVTPADISIFWAMYGGPPGPSGLACAGTPGCVSDADGDGVTDSTDNCIYVANPGQQDEDQDGYGTACDPDYNQNGVVTSTEFSLYFLPVYNGTLPYDPKVDHDSDGDVDDRDFLFLLRHFQLGLPGPSALDCAGTVPCPEPCG